MGISNILLIFNFFDIYIKIWKQISVCSIFQKYNNFVIFEVIFHELQNKKSHTVIEILSFKIC